jgi:hypothetical protein
MILRIAVAATACVVLVAACYDSDVTQPKASSYGLPSFFVSAGGALLPIRPTNAVADTNGGGGISPYLEIGTIGKRKWATVHVTGTVTTSRNDPALAECPSSIEPPHIGSYGAQGVGVGDYLKVSVFRSYGGGDGVDLAGTDSAVTAALFNPSADYLEAITLGREGIAGWLEGCAAGTIPYYKLSSNQAAEVVELVDPSVIALQSWTPKVAGDTMTFVAKDLPIPAWEWVFAPGDTGAAPDTIPPRTGTPITGCSNQERCTPTVTASGRMYIRLHDGFQDYAWYSSRVVWVGKQATEKLSVSCMGVEVNPGAQTECTAKSDGPGTPQVTQWFIEKVGATGGQFTVDLPSCVPQLECVVTIPWTARVYVRANLGGVEQTADVKVKIWSGCPTLAPSYTNTTSTWQECTSPTPLMMGAGMGSLKGQYSKPPDKMEKPWPCDTIFRVARNHLREYPVYVFEFDSRDKPEVDSIFLGGFYLRNDGARLIGIRKLQFSASGGALGMTIFHEGAEAFFHDRRAFDPVIHDSIDALMDNCVY